MSNDSNDAHRDANCTRVPRSRLRTANCELRTANCDDEAVLAELVSLTPSVVARIAPRRWREELAQNVLGDCWLAMQNGAVIRSPFDYVRTAARRAFARLLHGQSARWLHFDSRMIEAVPAGLRPCHEMRDVDTRRALLKSTLRGRLLAIYENHYEHGLGGPGDGTTLRM